MLVVLMVIMIRLDVILGVVMTVVMGVTVGSIDGDDTFRCDIWSGQTVVTCACSVDSDNCSGDMGSGGDNSPDVGNIDDDWEVVTPDV